MNNLKLPLVAPNQAQKEITINDQALALDAAFSEILDVDFAEGPQELDEEQFTRNFTFNCINLSADATLTVQPVKRLFSVQNSSAHGVTVDVFNEAGDTVVIEPGEMSILHCDGTNIRTAVAGGQVEGVADIDEQGFYVRIEGEWVEVEAGDNVSLNMVDGKLVISATGGGGGGGIPDAPDSSPYVRLQGEWLKLVAGSGVTFDTSTAGELRVNSVGGSGGGVYTISGTIGLSSTGNTQAATKGNVVSPIMDLVVVECIALFMGSDVAVGAEYEAIICELDGTTIISVTKSTLAIDDIGGSAEKTLRFNFANPVPMREGKNYYVGITRTSDSNTTRVPLSTAGTGGGAFIFPSQGGYIVSNSVKTNDSVSIYNSTMHDIRLVVDVGFFLAS